SRPCSARGKFPSGWRRSAPSADLVLLKYSSRPFLPETVVDRAQEAGQPQAGDQRGEADEAELELVHEANLAVGIGAEKAVGEIGELREEQLHVAARDHQEEEERQPDRHQVGRGEEAPRLEEDV